MSVRRGLMTFGLLALAGFCVRAGMGQVAAGPVDAAPDEGAMTLHAYADLVQMPVLVLGTARQRLPPVDPGLFRMTLDSGPPFRPTHVRPEGDDPITLAVLIDGDAGRNELLRGVADGVAALVSQPEQGGVAMIGPLQRQDHLLVSVWECGQLRSLMSPSADAGGLREAIAELVIHHPVSSDARADALACKAPMRLWDAMEHVIQDLSLLPGRRVMLAMTQGCDGGSVTGWFAMKSHATRESVTIFSVSQPVLRAQTAYLVEPQDRLSAVCEFTGGVRLWSTSRDLPRSLGKFVQLLRERYIIDFPRPAMARAGVLSVNVSLLKRDAFIRPSGVSFNLIDPKVLTDPTTVPSDPSRGPTIGTRRPLKGH